MESVPCGVMCCVSLNEDNSGSQVMISYFIGFVCRICSGANNVRLNVCIITLSESTQNIIRLFWLKPTINPLGTWNFIMAKSTHHMGWMLISYSRTLSTKGSLFCLEPMTVSVNMTISLWNLPELWRALSRCYRAAGQISKQYDNKKHSISRLRYITWSYRKTFCKKLWFILPVQRLSPISTVIVLRHFEKIHLAF